MKIVYILAGLFVVLLVSSAVVAASNNTEEAEDADLCTVDMMEESCPDEMMESGECPVMNQCQDMMGSGDQMMNEGCPGMDGSEVDDHISSMMDEYLCSMMDSNEKSEANSAGMMQMM